jgi:hypothetical protein
MTRKPPGGAAPGTGRNKPARKPKPPTSRPARSGSPQPRPGHKDPHTTRRYDHARDNLDRNAAYTPAAYLA